MTRVNTIVFCKDDYKTEQEWKDAVRDATFILLNAQYQMVIKYDEPGLGIIRIDFESADESLGAPWPYWLTTDLAEHILYEYSEANEEDSGADTGYGDEPGEELIYTANNNNENFQSCTTPCGYSRDEDSETTEATPTAQSTFDEFWRPLVTYSCDRTQLNPEAVKNELADYYFLMKQVPAVYSTVTGGVLSKHMYKAEKVIKCFMERYGNLAEVARLLPDDWDIITKDCKTNEDYKKVVLDYLNCSED